MREQLLEVLSERGLELELVRELVRELKLALEHAPRQELKDGLKMIRFQKGVWNEISMKVQLT